MTCAAILRFSTFVLSTDRPARTRISATRLTMKQRTGISLGLFLGILVSFNGRPLMADPLRP